MKDHPLTGTWRVAQETLDFYVLVTVAMDDRGRLTVTRLDTSDGEELATELLASAARSITWRTTVPSNGYVVRNRLWLNSDEEPVMTLQYDEP